MKGDKFLTFIILRRQRDTNLIPPIHMGEQSDRLVCDIAFVKIKDNTLSTAIF